MSRRDKQREALDALEAEFEAELVKALRAEDALLFAADDYIRWPGLRGRQSPIGRRLLERGDAILRERRRLGELADDSLAARFRCSCQRWCDTDDHHRGSAASVARSLREELESRATRHGPPHPVKD